MPALSSMAVSAFSCSSAPNTGLRTSRCRSGALGDQGVESLEIGLDRVDRFCLERELEQGAGVAASHAGSDRVFACHVDARFFDFDHRLRAVADGRRNLLEFKREFRSPRTTREPAEKPS